MCQLMVVFIFNTRIMPILLASFEIDGSEIKIYHRGTINYSSMSHASEVLR